jgi:hypothetical protein
VQRDDLPHILLLVAAAAILAGLAWRSSRQTQSAETYSEQTRPVEVATGSSGSSKVWYSNSQGFKCAHCCSWLPPLSLLGLPVCAADTGSRHRNKSPETHRQDVE